MRTDGPSGTNRPILQDSETPSDAPSLHSVFQSGLNAAQIADMSPEDVSALLVQALSPSINQAQADESGYEPSAPSDPEDRLGGPGDEIPDPDVGGPGDVEDKEGPPRKDGTGAGAAESGVAENTRAEEELRAKIREILESFDGENLSDLIDELQAALGDASLSDWVNGDRPIPADSPLNDPSLLAALLERLG